MPSSFKDFSDLQLVSLQLKKEREEKLRLEAVRLEKEKQAAIEANIFRSTVGEVSAIKNKDQYIAPLPKPKPIPFKLIEDEKAALAESLSDEFDADSLLETDDNLSFTRPHVGLDVAKKLRKGYWTIQAQLDLHGMRRDQARDSLGDFLRQCQRKGFRCVRIIHGKGLGSINKEPVLKGKVRNWLIQKEEVIAFSQATAADGGAGALLVLLQG